METHGYAIELESGQKLLISAHARKRIAERGVPLERLVLLAGRVVTVSPKSRGKWSWKGVTAVLKPTKKNIVLVTCWIEGESR